MRPEGSRTGPAASAHIVQFYERDAFLVEEVARFIGAGLGAGDGAVLIATEVHRVDVEKLLADRGLDVASARAEGRYVAFDAATILSRIMQDGRPDPTRFAQVVGGALRAARSTRGHVRAFGEMVALLWADGNREAALRLEQLWNELGRELPFSLLCAYPIAPFGSEAEATSFRAVCAEHTKVVPDESYSALTSADERLRVIADLQRKARALEAEVAQRKGAEEALRGRNQTLRALIEASPLPIVMIDPDATVRLWNPAAERVFGWTEKEVLGRPIPIVPPEKQDECAGVREAVGRGESRLGVETYRARRDGTTIPVAVSAAPIADGAGDVLGVVLLFEDMTERNRTEAARQKALADLIAASRAKDEFLAMLGHELRNPLSAVRNAVVTARFDPERRDRALDIARRGVDQLARLVDDLLDVARITRGRITLRTRRLRFSDVVERAVEATRSLVEERVHTLNVSLPESDVPVDGDSTRLEQVIVNLINNAVKYTDPGGRIAVSLERDGGEAVLRVRDDGIGIAREMLPRVFDLFAQSDRALDRAEGGLGIGLTVVKQLVELHGGRVEARSDGSGTGAEFVVRLPLALEEARAAAAPALDGARAACARVLLVEDNADAAESLAMLLQLLGHRVVVVHDGPGALEAAQAQAPDLMLVDIGLPGMDGYEVARRIRADEGLRGVTLVALTGYGRDTDREQALAAGFDHHLVKPVNPEALEGLVARISSAPASPGRAVH